VSLVIPSRIAQLITFLAGMITFWIFWLRLAVQAWR